MDGRTAVARIPAPLQLSRHVIVALAIGLVAPFTGLAWPFAILTGMVIGRSGVDREHGVRTRAAARLVQALAVTGGVLAMFVFGALLGGLIAFLIVALASFSERLAADASPTDRTLARLTLVAGAVAVDLVLVFALNLRVDVRFGG